MGEEKKYQPIACSIYDHIEIMAMRGTVQLIVYKQGNEIVEITSKIHDVFSKDKEEFIRVKENQIIRLDRLIKLGDIEINGTC